ncbi:MAG: peptidylprolyl isomerase [Algisphaera sp.]
MDSSRPLAYVSGQPIRVETLWPALIEAAGGTALSDAVLSQLVADRLASVGITLTEADHAAERDQLAQTLSDDPDVAARLVKELRQRRGLGEVRYAALIARNAGLRALVRDGVKVQEPAVQQAYRLAYGPSVRVRLIVAPTLVAAARLSKQLAAGDGTDATFARLASEESTDSSGRQGGLLSPMRPDDTSYPQSIRDAAAALASGEVSPPVTVEGGFALLRCLEHLPARTDVSLEAIRPHLETQVRRRAERILMQQAARELVSGADVVVLNPTLSKGWKQERAKLLAPR